MSIRGMGSTGKVRKPGNNAYLGLTVPKPVTAWKRAHAHARKEGLLTKRGDRLKDRGEWHITVMSPQELRSLKAKHPELQTDAFELPLSGSKGVKYKGIGRQQQGDKTVYYVIVDWPAAQEFRAKFGLPKYDFHVTIGFVGGDIFNVPKDQSTRISMERYAGMSRQEVAAKKKWKPTKMVTDASIRRMLKQRIVAKKSELTIDALDADPELIKRIVKIAKKLGFNVAGTDRWILIRDLRGM